MRLKAESEKIYNDGKNKFNELLGQEVKRDSFLQFVKCDPNSAAIWHQPVVLQRGVHYD